MFWIKEMKNRWTLILFLKTEKISFLLVEESNKNNGIKFACI